MVLTLLIVIVVLTAIVSAISPCRLSLSDFERTRRHKAGDEAASYEMQKQQAAPVLLGMQRMVIALLLVAFAFVSVDAYGWMWGIVATIMLVALYGVPGRVTFFASIWQRLYEKAEPAMVSFIVAHSSWLGWVFGSGSSTGRMIFHSKAEFLHTLSDTDVLGPHEKELIRHGMEFTQMRVASVMTPRKDIATIKKNEILGPLVLDDLHKTGHSCFPVVDDSIDRIIGMVHVRDILTLDTSRRHTAKAESAMTKQVYYIHQDATLEEALSAFLATHHHMLVVIDDDQKTAGLVTLKTAIEKLFGRTLDDSSVERASTQSVSAPTEN